MPIEFRCSQCGKLLRTGDDTAGRQAQCPGCGTISVVPSPTAPSAPSVPPLAPLDTSLFSEPLAGVGTTEFQNPYRPPTVPWMGTPAAQRVSGPATALIVMAILGIVACLGIAALYGAILVTTLNGHGPALQSEQERAHLVLGSSMFIAAGVFGALMGALVLFGAMRMRKLQSYALSIASAIIIMIPGISPCCLLGLPFGIWAIVVLNDRSVRAAFRS